MASAASGTEAPKPAALAKPAAAPAKPAAPLPDLAKAHWIWAGANPLADGVPEVLFRKVLDLPSKPKSAVVLVTADNGYDLYVGESLVGGDAGFDAEYWQSVERYDITALLAAGKNVLGVKGLNMGGPAGMLLAARIELEDGTVIEVQSDKSWRTYLLPETAWSTAAYDDAAWLAAVDLGPLGMAPWGKLTYPGPVSPAHAGSASVGRLVEPGPDFQWPEGIVFLRGRVQTPGPQAIWRIGLTRGYLEHDAPIPAIPGRQLYSLVPARPDGKLTCLVDAGAGLVGSPRASFDGKTVYFAMAPAGESFFHIYQIGSDGKGLRALTQGNWHDYDPEPLPGGRLAFSSTRIGSREEYHGNVASSLFTMRDDGAEIRPLTHHIVADREPRLTADGTIVFVRSDNFLERAKVETQIHEIRPDGSAGQVILGADRGAIPYDRSRAAEGDAAWLRSFGYGSPAPLPDGRIAALGAQGLVASRGESGPERLPAAFTPFDISATPDGRLLATLPGQTMLAILDLKTGDAVGLYRSPTADLHSVAFLGVRPKPPAVASHLVPADETPGEETGTLYCQSVFRTRQAQGQMARVRAVRLYEGRPLALRSTRHPYDHIGVEAVELGTVPLAADGSFFVKVPADRALAVQAVDAEGRSVVNELSWIYVRPGEQRSCVGCHAPRTAAPAVIAEAAAAPVAPVALLGQGQPHRFRGNNAANGGVLNLQLDRFREAAAIDLYPTPVLKDADADKPLAAGRPGDVARLLRVLAGGTAEQKIAAANHLGLFRDRAAVKGLLAALKDPSPELRIAAGLALAACGDRTAVPGLLDALGDKHPLTAQAAHVALEHLTGHAAAFDAMAAARDEGAKAWREWIARNDWPAIEADLVARLADKDPCTVQMAIEALGHTGGDAAKAALRDFLAKNPDGDLRILMAAMRALGHLGDAAAVPILAEHLKKAKTPVQGGGSQEFGWQQKPIYLAATAAEALGWIATPEAEKTLVDAYPALGDFWYYTWHVADHDWLMGSHSSPLHYRIAEALDAMGTKDLGGLVPLLLRSVPIDSDRGLLLESDAYESLVARVVQRSGQAPAVLEACLAALSDPAAKPADALKAAVTASPPAASTGAYPPEARAAQVASVIALDARAAARLREAFDRFRATPPSAKRSYTCFYLARALGKVRDRGAADSLLAALEKDPTEGALGFDPPPSVFIYKTWTPFYRAAAAYALGEIGDARAAPALLKVIAGFDNAIDVRYAAAEALGHLGAAAPVAEMRQAAADCPEVATRRALLRACAEASGAAAVVQGDARPQSR